MYAGIRCCIEVPRSKRDVFDDFRNPGHQVRRHNCTMQAALSAKGRDN